MTQADNTETSKAILSFKSNGQPLVPPVIKPTDPDGATGAVGSLALVNQTPFVFGTETIRGGDFYLDQAVHQTLPNVQVTDARGLNSGWTLKASITPFMEGQKVLSGARFFLPKADLVTDPHNPPEFAPETFERELTDAEQVVMQATKDHGNGPWAALFEIDKTKGRDKVVHLSVPTGNKIGDYKATLTWTLSNSPTA